MARPIVYTNETYIHRKYTTPKEWLIIVHAESGNALISNELLILKSTK